MKHFLFHWCSVPGKGIDSANGHGICRIFSMGGSFAEVPQILLCAFNLLSGAITNNLKLYYISPIHACDFLGSGRMPVFTVIPHSPLQYPDPTHSVFVCNLPSRAIQERFQWQRKARRHVASVTPVLTKPHPIRGCGPDPSGSAAEATFHSDPDLTISILSPQLFRRQFAKGISRPLRTHMTASTTSINESYGRVSLDLAG